MSVIKRFDCGGTHTTICTTRRTQLHCMWYSILTDSYKTSMTACSVWSWVLLSYQLQFSVRRIGCHGIQFRWRHSLFHDFFILTPLLLVINSCSTKNTNLQVEYRTRATLLIIIFNDSSEVTKAVNLKAIEKPREEGRGKRKPPPSPSSILARQPNVYLSLGIIFNSPQLSQFQLSNCDRSHCKVRQTRLLWRLEHR